MKTAACTSNMNFKNSYLYVFLINLHDFFYSVLLTVSISCQTVKLRGDCYCALKGT
jgi:hypothetical protein